MYVCISISIFICIIYLYVGRGLTAHGGVQTQGESCLVPGTHIHNTYIYEVKYVGISIYLSIYLSIFLSVHGSIYLYIYLSLYASMYLSIYMHTNMLCIFISVSISISISVIYLYVGRGLSAHGGMQTQGESCLDPGTYIYVCICTSISSSIIYLSIYRVHLRYVCMYIYVHIYLSIKSCKEKHSNTTAHHPVVKPPAAASTAV